MPFPAVTIYFHNPNSKRPDLEDSKNSTRRPLDCRWTLSHKERYKRNKLIQLHNTTIYHHHGLWLVFHFCLGCQWELGGNSQNPWLSCQSWRRIVSKVSGTQPKELFSPGAHFIKSCLNLAHHFLHPSLSLLYFYPLFLVRYIDWWTILFLFTFPH